MSSLEYREMLEGFSDYYAAAASPAVTDLERRVLGGGYGGNSYTTADQAIELADLLELRVDTQLLGRTQFIANAP